MIIVIIVIGALESAGGGDDEEKAEPASASASTTEKKSDNKPKTEKKVEKKSFEIGDTVKVGDMVYNINKKGIADEVGPSVLTTKASGKFVVLDVTLKNNGNKAVTVDASFFKLKRGDKTYEADTEASMSANQSEDGNIDNSFFLQEVNPDSEIKGRVVFDVAPEVANAKDLAVQVQTGVFGTETETINLK